MTRYGFVIDQKRCVGCQTCAVACKSFNNLPDGVWWNRVMTDGGDAMDTAGGVYPNNYLSFVPVACQHCENPACVKVCPVGATYKDAETGVVRQDYDKCIGCRMCMSACPYTGVRSFNWDEPQYQIDVVVGDSDVAPHQKHTVEKCTMCWNRLAKGLAPACVEVCPAKARFWGDLDDPDSDVASKLAGRREHQLLEEMGTRPSVYYLS
ncbi:4Fe-4S dicluster domain-containing protein [Parvibacter caecicola]|uniref:4Fe-4S dicluster domain-containing protein n=1 Tax=Parvibacter caecicola TaxID=747645 RepID=UPI002499EED6|nr:4Fe-4S dicluster domain-containing protein [Parvibacter caecicola]